MRRGVAMLGMVVVTVMWSSAGVVTRHLEAARGFEITFWRSAFNAAALVVMMLATTVALFAGAGGFLRALGFSSNAVLNGELWRIVSYGVVNPPSLSFALEVVMLVWFGREVEKALGRTPFLQLSAGIYLVKPLLFTAVGAWFGASFSGATLSFPLFVAFATLFPGVPLLFNILAKWAAALGPMSRIMSPALTALASTRLARAMAASSSATTTSSGSGTEAPRAFIASITACASPTRSGSASDLPMRMPEASMKVLAMPPPTIN